MISSALADQCHVRQTAVAPAQRYQARRPVRSAADRVDGREIPRQQLVASDDFQLRAMRRGEFACDLFQLLRPHVLSGRVDQVAHAHASGQQIQRFGIGILQQQARRLACGFLVTVEAIAAQTPTQLQRRARVGFQRRSQPPVARRQAEWRMRVGIGIQRIADADRGSSDAVFARQQQQRARCCEELLRIHPGLQGGRQAIAPASELLA
jgi:hypothetical protein